MTGRTLAPTLGLRPTLGGCSKNPCAKTVERPRAPTNGAYGVGMRSRVSIAALAVVVLSTTASAPASAAATYDSCVDMIRDWPTGVAKGPVAAREQVRDGNRRPASGKRAQKVYRANKTTLDLDHDGAACENRVFHGFG